MKSKEKFIKIIKKNLYLFLTYLIICICILFLCVFLGDSFCKIKEYRSYFYQNHAYLVCPSYEDYNFLMSKENFDKNSVTLYGKEVIEIEGLNYEVIYSSNLENGEILILDETIKVYKTEEALDKSKIYQTQSNFKFATKKDLSLLKLPLVEDKTPSFLYKYKEMKTIEYKGLYLIVFNKESELFYDFCKMFGYPNIRDGLTIESRCFAYGTDEANSTGIIQNILKFVSVIYFIPIIFFVVWIKYIYEFFMQSELKELQIHYYFYKTKSKIWGQEFIRNLCLFLLCSFFALGAYSIFVKITKEAILLFYLFILLEIMILFFFIKHLVYKNLRMVL